MRTKGRELLAHPNHLGSWWYEHPARRSAFWRAGLFECGQGWLRWGTDQRDAWEYDDNAQASYICGVYTVAPPLRRLALYLRQWCVMPRLMLWGVPSDDGEPRYRFSWEEARPYWPSDMKDDDRKRLWS